jgi:cephalosporin-C deacetylase
MNLHVLHGIAARETYVHGGCVADTWCAVTALQHLVPEAAARIAYLGGSFGGGIGTLALPWDDRIDAGCLVVPSFGNHPLRLTFPCVGSGAAVRRHVQRHPDVLDVLRYFDAATAAKFVRVPTHVGLALADASVPPPGQFAIFNALAGPRERFLLRRGHVDDFEATDEAAALRASQRDFLSRR